MGQPGGISWDQLLTLMVHGPDPEPPVRGTIVDWPGEHFGAVPLPRPYPVLAGTGLRTREDGTSAVRVWRDGNLARICDYDGTLKLIVGAELCWDFTEDDEVPASSPAARVWYRFGGTDLLVRQFIREYLESDVIRPTGPVEPTSLLGRPAWSVALTAPRQPHPLELVVDAETGLILRRRTDRSGPWAEWTEFVVGEPPPDWFSWTGPSRTAASLRASRRAKDAANRRRRERWLSEPVLPLLLQQELKFLIWVHSYEPDTGAFYADIGGKHHGMLARRPADAQDDWALEWDRPGHRWRDERWEWALYVQPDHLSPSGLAELKRQLRTT